MEYKIEKRIIPGLPDIPLKSSRFIIAHESGNIDNTGPDSLEREVDFMTANWRNAFTSHFVGSGGRIIQLAPVGKFQYGAGPKANPYAFAQVELSRTKDPDTFKKDYAAYIWLLRKLAENAGLPKTLDTGSGIGDRGIKSHDWIRRYIGGTTHTDPFAYLAQFGISKAQFKKDLEKGTVSQPAKPATKPAPAKPPVSGTYTGNSIVDYLKSIGMDSSPANRRRLAKEYGVENYDLSAEKNLELLRKMRGGASNRQRYGTVHLPANANTWRTYKLGVKPVKENSDWSLTPSRYGGLTYEIIGRPYPDVVTINTSRGKRNIYVGPETGAVIR